MNKDRFITCELKHLAERCVERGYQLTDVMDCVVEQKDGKIVVDTHHNKYPRKKTVTPSKFKPIPKPEHIKEGVGTELKKLLKLVGITASPNCSCNHRATLMNNSGIQWCIDNREEILDWLAEEAKKRGLPFLRYGANKVLSLAIYRAKKNPESKP